MAAIDALQLDIDSQTVKWSILGTPRIKLKEQHVRCAGHDKLLVFPTDDSRTALLFQLEALLLSLPKVGGARCWPAAGPPLPACRFTSAAACPQQLPLAEP
jgi:hypothetical protein